MATSIPRDIGSLRAEFDRRFATNPTCRYVVRMILGGLADIWSNEQGIPEEKARPIDAAMSPAFDALLASTTMQEAYACLDDLVRAWERISPIAAGVSRGF